MHYSLCVGAPRLPFSNLRPLSFAYNAHQPAPRQPPASQPSLVSCPLQNCARHSKARPSCPRSYHSWPLKCPRHTAIQLCSPLLQPLTQPYNATTAPSPPPLLPPPLHIHQELPRVTPPLPPTDPHRSRLPPAAPRK